jgi:proteasome accessory factor C
VAATRRGEHALTQEAGRLERRLRRILLMLPYAIRNPGVTVGELAQRFDASPEKVVEDLQLVFLCGLPGYGPGDLIDVAITEDRVFVDMADYFAAPLRLTPEEAVALYAGGEALVALPGMEEADALKRALAKLGDVLGAQEGADGGGIEMRILPGPAAHLARLRDALSRRRRVAIEYMSASRGELTAREVDPWALIVAWGRSYLVGLDHLSGEERMFRTDRVKSVTVTDADAPAPDRFEPQRYTRAFLDREGERSFELEISPGVARWFLDYYPVRSVVELDDGWRRVEMAASSDHWAATVLLRLGVEARAAQPTTAVEAAARLADAIAAAHEAVPEAAPR